MNRLIVAALCAGLAGVASTAEATPDSGQTITVALEVGEAKPGRPVSLVLTLSGEHGCASAEDQRPGIEHKVQVCREGGTATAPILAFDVERNKNNTDNVERRHFRLRARVGAGVPRVLGQIGQGEDRFEIRAGLLE